MLVTRDLSSLVFKDRFGGAPAAVVHVFSKVFDEILSRSTGIQQVFNASRTLFILPLFILQSGRTATSDAGLFVIFTVMQEKTDGFLQFGQVYMVSPDRSNGPKQVGRTSYHKSAILVTKSIDNVFRDKVKLIVDVVDDIVKECDIINILFNCLPATLLTIKGITVPMWNNQHKVVLGGDGLPVIHVVGMAELTMDGKDCRQDSTNIGVVVYVLANAGGNKKVVFTIASLFMEFWIATAEFDKTCNASAAKWFQFFVHCLMTCCLSACLSSLFVFGAYLTSCP
mmetsp:Transcript_2759/g.6466  ORF Transcript_2759/g.6466 Transcript_2759/m.6466 type:complete len:283 (+) Transcript_2759:550-1398(+)